MKTEMKRKKRVRFFLLRILPEPIIRLVVFLKGSGIRKHPKYTNDSVDCSDNCTVAVNEYGTFCTPKKYLTDEPVQAVYRGEQYEAKTVSRLKSIGIDGDIIHAGAYFGDLLPAFSSLLGNGYIIWAFEPNPISFRCATMTIKLNDLRNVNLFNFGLGQKNTEGNLLTANSEKELGGTTRLTDTRSTNTIDVPIKKLDDTIPDNRPISLIHLDVEGYEEKVISGAENLINKYKPIIIIEYRGQETDDLMNKINYEFVEGLEERKWKESYRNALFKSVS